MPRSNRIGGPPTMRDVAHEAGVSKALVSIVFRGAPGASDDTRAHVFATAERLGYRHNRTASLLAMSRNRQLGVVMDLHNSFHADLVDVALAEADSRGYRLVLSPRTTDHTEERAILTALEFRCEALLLIGPQLRTEDITRLTGTTPVVAVGRRVDLTNVDVVRGAEDHGMAHIVDHLAALGHRRIAHVDGGADPIAIARRAGFEDRTRQRGLRGGSTTIRGGRSESDGAQAATELLRQPGLPTAVAAFNDHCALGVIDTFTRAGLRVPEDISVTGYDDSPLAGMHAVNLTSVRQDPQRFAQLAVTAAVERLDAGREEPRESVIEPELVVRGSSAPAPDRL